MQYSVLRQKLELNKIDQSCNGLSFLTHYLSNIHNENHIHFESHALNYINSHSGLSNSLDFRSLENVNIDVPFSACKNPSFTFVDLFCGIGGFRIALQNNGGKCLFSCDVDIYARRIYEINYGELPFGDIRSIDPSIIPRHDILCAGFPCQPFSISGHRKGYHDVRGALVANLLDIIKVKNPKVVLLENVKHFIYHDNGRTIQELKNAFEEIGYLISYNVLNASDFGLPQNRERLIIVCHKEKKFDFNKVSIFPKASLIDFLDFGEQFELLKDQYTLINNPVKQKSGIIFVGHRNQPTRVNGARPNTEHLSRVHKQPNRIYSIHGVFPTLSAMERSGRYWIHDGSVVRKLTIKECYRIMGFPSAFIISSSKQQAYKQIGNSVCIPMVESIIKAVEDQGLLK